MIFDKTIADQVAESSNRGYWSVNNKVYFFNKFETLKYATDVKSDQIKYHYFDDFYKNLNWHIEPSESLNELYQRRAQNLRDKYEYLILLFSGGADSSNALHSFVDNGIHLDEVITSYPKTLLKKLLPSFDRNNKFHGNSAFEYFEAALPRLQWLSKNHPNVKITDIDATQTALQLVTTGKMSELSHSGFPPVIPIVGTYIPAYLRAREIFDQGKKICWITGNDKPRILYNPKEKIFKTYWQDISFTHGALDNHALSGFKPTVENFYYNQDIVEITLKQCALIKKALIPIFRHQDLSVINAQNLIQSVTERGNYVIDVHHDFIKKILYPQWDTSIFQAEKPENQGHGDGNGYQYYYSGLLDKNLLDHAWGQIRDWYGAINENLLVKDRFNRSRERMYATDAITLKFS